MNGKTVLGKYELFLQKYNKGVRKYVPIYRAKKSIQARYSGKYIEAKRKKR
ncbi:hypothetical protein E2C01_000800 [Portunus trituberculatus]|uniref:Uncharacterized protein n=1 Tax=Portunus trituberculatus TaxID=210409 RepID=A0A5B7CHK7_PORTR|nr:hypothetical protein [Portunus trituberculatus]